VTARRRRRIIRGQRLVSGLVVHERADGVVVQGPGGGDETLGGTGVQAQPVPQPRRGRWGAQGDGGAAGVDLTHHPVHPGVGAALRGVGTVLKAGNTLTFTEAEIWCERTGQPDLLIAKASATMMAFQPAGK